MEKFSTSENTQNHFWIVFNSRMQVQLKKIFNSALLIDFDSLIENLEEKPRSRKYGAPNHDSDFILGS